MSGRSRWGCAFILWALNYYFFYYFFVGAIGVHEGQLYVEIQTELDHSDIHVLDLDEDE